ncbi:S-formylglutathione hydrol [Ceraceosorus guamensis]|uniref:S-formylglutathione hydrolase n=1 Tax=Ceraceosorus guamensis TaxID=1522189 RepID=A0A316W058_9BASI|nr:S-formylglutathione hydrol [Ceraceosorus guamensis]PWN41941.1 S-formylglutathione hydrol [Ceraceosorus guamensis]
MSLKQESLNKTFGGELRKYSYQSQALGGLTTNLNVFLPPTAIGASAKAAPVLYYLAGLTCTEDNGAQKGGMFGAAASHGIALVFPDTSPRGAKIEGEDESWDFGTGAGFYVNADKAPWNKHYNTYDYVVREIPAKLSEAGLPIAVEKASIFGHSMGGHGALSIYLREAGKYKSASAFAPISHPTACPWGEKAFSGYFNDAAKGKEHDSTELISQAGGSSKRQLNILIDSGTGDNFYKQKQLLPEDFEAAARKAGYDAKDVNVRLQEGYDHSYFFISTFAGEHINWHAKFLTA